MYKVGIFPGKFFPPHRGHLNAIIRASTQVEKLYVIISDADYIAKEKCLDDNINFLSLRERVKWLSIELQGFEHIKVLTLDETKIKQYPYGWEEWSNKVFTIVPEKIDVIFGGEPSYTEGYQKWYPNCQYIIFDYKRQKYPVSGTEVRKHPFKYWDYILGSARPFFTKKILITGVESCGKTTMVKYLAKIYHTSWSEEVGRYYSRDYLGGNESIFTKNDFERIVLLQDEQDKKAIHSANKITFFDSDALLTQYYLDIYLKEYSETINTYIENNKNKYDIILYFEPDVKWVADGFRFISNQREREEKSEMLYKMYQDKYTNIPIIKINGNYLERLDKTIEIVDNIIKEKS